MHNLALPFAYSHPRSFPAMTAYCIPQMPSLPYLQRYTVVARLAVDGETSDTSPFRRRSTRIASPPTATLASTPKRLSTARAKLLHFFRPSPTALFSTIYHT